MNTDIAVPPSQTGRLRRPRGHGLGHSRDPGQPGARQPALPHRRVQTLQLHREDGAPTGFAIDLLHLVWQKTGTPVQPVSILPWARGYYLLTQKPNVVLFSTARTEARNPLFKWACPIGYAEIVLMGLASRP